MYTDFFCGSSELEISGTYVLLYNTYIFEYTMKSDKNIAFDNKIFFFEMRVGSSTDYL